MNKSKQVIDIGRYARVPRHIARSGVSPRAQQIWQEVAINSSPQIPWAWVRQDTIATELRCSTDTVGRAIKELCKAGLLVDMKQYHLGRYKYYIVMWTVDTLKNLPHFQPATPWGTKAEPKAVVAEVPPQIDPNLIRVREEQKKNLLITPSPVPKVAVPKTADQLLEAYEATWKEKNPYLDGNSGRPSVRDCVVEAMNHTARHKCDDVKIYIESWLRSAALKYKYDFQQEQALHWSDPRLSPEAQRKKREDEDERRRAYEERQQRRFEEWAQSSRIEPTPEIKRQTEIFLAQVRRDREREKRLAAAYA